MARAHVMIAGYDDDALPISGKHSVCQLTQKIESFAILLSQLAAKSGVPGDTPWITSPLTTIMSGERTDGLSARV